MADQTAQPEAKIDCCYPETWSACKIHLELTSVTGLKSDVKVPAYSVNFFLCAQAKFSASTHCPNCSNDLPDIFQ
jgi:hypothetical protein